MQTVGRQQAKRFYAAARLTRDEREAVIRFLEDMTGELSLTGSDWAEAGAAGANQAEAHRAEPDRDSPSA